MRLIDADVLLRCIPSEDITSRFAVENAPTIEAEAVKRGKWEHGKELSREFIGGKLVSINYEDFHCSVCGEKYKNKDTIMTFKYCPNCGCQMDEVEE